MSAAVGIVKATLTREMRGIFHGGAARVEANLPGTSTVIAQFLLPFDGKYPNL